ncbi:GNAT family N-acetyltransferase [Micromonospora mirobrigensis]|uniref:FR47-like protein n=1 Tax=Micromonospora mirobrigensis TaxID=262898 RepID=A0A1C4ZFV3_9ACTN|nr:GNAT family N-acetyltransferase [Micromonospora mirobrigensis]SCF31696.1 FR47-like protein [Micromonospora mirobrigensis]
MINADQPLVGRDAVLHATGHHPYARHALARGDEQRGWLRDGAVVWLAPPGVWPAAGAVGPAGPAADLLRSRYATGELPGGVRLPLPRAIVDELAGWPPLSVQTSWDYLFMSTPPPRHDGEERVVRLTEADHPELTALIDAAFPASTSRPGDAHIVDWYGIRDGGRLVACGADRSRGDVGFLAGLAVDPARRGRGLGATLTVGMARALFARYDQVALGAYLDNVGAIRLYRRLGFTGTVELNSVRID